MVAVRVVAVTVEMAAVRTSPLLLPLCQFMAMMMMSGGALRPRMRDDGRWWYGVQCTYYVQWCAMDGLYS